MNKVFLGGTCNNSKWREKLISLIEVDYFNPVVQEWMPFHIDIENKEKLDRCNVHLYVITSEMTGVYSIAEAVDSSHMFNKTTIFHVIPDGFTDSQLSSLKAVAEIIRKNGGMAFVDSEIDGIARIVNYCFKED